MGNLTDKSTSKPTESVKGWVSLMLAANSPIAFFSLMAMICTTIFSLAAATFQDTQLFTYCIHMFLGIIGVFTLIVLWNPIVLYSPESLKNFSEEDFAKVFPNKGNRVVPTFVVFGTVVVYMGYQYLKLLQENSGG